MYIFGIKVFRHWGLCAHALKFFLKLWVVTVILDRNLVVILFHSEGAHLGGRTSGRAPPLI